MNKKFVIVGAVIASMMLGGCTVVQRVERATVMNLPGSYHIIQYHPGTDKENHYWLRDVRVTQENGTDGVFFIKDGILFELTGTLTVIRLAGDFTGAESMPDGLTNR